MPDHDERDKRDALVLSILRILASMRTSPIDMSRLTSIVELTLHYLKKEGVAYLPQFHFSAFASNSVELRQAMRDLEHQDFVFRKMLDPDHWHFEKKLLNLSGPIHNGELIKCVRQAVEIVDSDRTIRDILEAEKAETAPATTETK